jgi:U3 small nucleolar RNA-associated protein 11
MSSLRNAVKRIAHKERSQPVDRQHLGILEKKKDYKKRAIDYHRKEERIKAMKEKASMRNPDEFYFGMHNSKVQNGKHRSTDDYRDLDPEVVKVMKGQDLSYVRMQKQKDAKKAERLQASLHLLDSESDGVKPKRKHTVFVDSRKEALEFDVAEHFGTIPEFAERAFNRLRKEDIEKLAKVRTGVSGTGADGDDDGGDNEKQELTVAQLEKKSKLERKIAKKLAKARSNAYGELEARRKRGEELQKAEDHLVTEKLVSSKGRKRKIKAAEDGRPAQFKWRRKRLG